MPLSNLDNEPPRVLVVAGRARQPDLLALFERAPLSASQIRSADCFSQARFLLQHDPCDAMVVTDDLVETEGSQGLAWLALHHKGPVLLLGGQSPEPYLRALELGLAGCLPLAMITAQPLLLHTALQQALQAREGHLGNERTRLQLAETRRHVDRLVQMIWRMTPYEDEHWCSQRHVLDRLFEELARCRRHQVPLSVAVGELHTDEKDGKAQLPDWAAELLLRGKRRCDVVGHYGPNGFLLLMVHTPKPGGVICCKRLQDTLAHPPESLGPPYRTVRSLFGVASTSEEHSSPQGLLRMAEQNLERARPDAALVAD